MISAAVKRKNFCLFLSLSLCWSLQAQESLYHETSPDITNRIITSILEQPLKLSDTPLDIQEKYKLLEEKRTIRTIIVQNNNLVSAESILIRIPYKQGDVFQPHLSSQAIKNIFALNYFRQVQIYVDMIEDDKVDLCIVVTEKPRLTDIIFHGTKQVSEKDIKKEINIEKITTINPEELKNLEGKIKKLYHEKNYHFTTISSYLENVDDNHVIAHFDIQEGYKAYVRRILFQNNKSIPSRQLKKLIFTKEVWLLSMMDHSGSYHDDMIEADKAILEDTYKSNGFIHAAVPKVEVNFDEATKSYDITYVIQEGEMYFIKDVIMQENEFLTSEQLKASIPLQPGQPYSVSHIRKSIERLRLLWGEYGFIFADIEPSIDIDEETKTVSISFNFDLKDKVFLNRLGIKGNKKSQDKIIRRQITMDEGDLITNKKMDMSRDKVKLMGYFDERDGVNWKITRIDENHADLDLMLKEKKTGRFNFQLSYGGTTQGGINGAKGIVGSLILADTNLWGSGIAAKALAEVAERQQSINLQLMNPWLFDKPIRGSFDTYFRKTEYADGLDSIERKPVETVIGGYIGSGYLVKFMGESIIESQIGFETINFADQIIAARRLPNKTKQIYDLILNRTFQSGDQYWWRTSIGQDRRNGLVFATNGYQWNWYSQLSFPMSTNGFHFFKSELDATWYTPLIGDNSLVLCMHGHLGFIHPLDQGSVPWKSLFHMGGPTTIRGYTYGQVGPSWEGDSMGSTKAFNVNVEFIVPLTLDLTTRAVFFYDGGAGWDAPYKGYLRNKVHEIDPNFPFDEHLKNDSFFYRHSVGVGIRMLRPTPIQVDFGIKLNPAKIFKNNLTELHFSMTHEF